MPVRQMPAMREIHAENRIAILNRGEIDTHVCPRAAMRLHVRVIGAEQFLGAIDRGLLDHVSVFTAAIVTLAGVAFGVLVGKD